MQDSPFCHSAVYSVQCIGKSQTGPPTKASNDTSIMQSGEQVVVEIKQHPPPCCPVTHSTIIWRLLLRARCWEAGAGLLVLAQLHRQLAEVHRQEYPSWYM